MKTTRIILEPPCPFLTANQRLHWRKKAELTKTWRAAAHELALDEVNRGINYERVHVYAHFRFPDNRRRDVANWYPTCKAALDGAVSAGLLVDDSDAYLTGPDLRRDPVNGPPLLTLVFKEL